MAQSGVFFRKKNKNLAKRVLDFYEDVRVKYLTAREDPKEYGEQWRKSVEKIRDDFDGLSSFTNEMKKYLDEEVVFNKNTLDPESNHARDLYAQIKRLRYNSDEVNDPFAKQLGDRVIETFISKPAIYAMFIHYALRTHSHGISSASWEQEGINIADIAEGVEGLDLRLDDIPIYIIEHYGDNKDTSKIKPKFKPALELLKKVYLRDNTEEDWEKLIAIRLEKSEDSKEEKADTDFIIPNKPMYRIFEVKDIEELKGFSGEWLVQEKYDGIRVQLHKIKDKVKIYSYNEKDITSKCKDIVDKLKQKRFGDCIFDAELILYDKDEPLHRADTIAHLFKNKYPDAKLKARVFDIMHHEGKNLADNPLRERINTLFYQLSQNSSDELGFPNKKNTRIADSLAEVEKYSKDIMELPASEGVVIKDIESTYYIGTKKNPKWIKMKKFVDLDLIVLDKKTTKSNLNSYTLGAGPLSGEEAREHGGTELKGIKYLPVGKALNTKEDVDVGDIVRVKVDEVRKTPKGYKLYTAKVIELPEVEQPEKLITLDLLSKEGRKTLKYEVREALKKYIVTDNIHGEAEIIMKGDFDGYTIYGFSGDTLMEKNALADIDLWKHEITELMKAKSGDARVAIKSFLHDKDPDGKGTHVRDIQKFAKEKIPELSEALWDNDMRKLVNWLTDFDDFVKVAKDTFVPNKDKLIKADTPKSGTFSIYYGDDDNLEFIIETDKKDMAWTIDIEDTEDIYNLFGKSGKFPAQVADKTTRGKLIDSGKIKLGVQRHGYHEYKINGKKFDTRVHFRVVPVNEEDTWLVWTGVKQKMLDADKDEGIWDITEDRHKKLTMQVA
tara:strand:- start:828 stop:3338 length:2511 start_codon:yes stop_codon:yes gene_type:complete